jgi:hypothetical protein
MNPVFRAIIRLALLCVINFAAVQWTPIPSSAGRGAAGMTLSRLNVKVRPSAGDRGGSFFIAVIWLMTLLVEMTRGCW